MAKVFFSSPIDGIKISHIVARYNRGEKALSRRGHVLVNGVEFYRSHHFQPPSRERDCRSIVEADLAMLRKADILLVDVSASQRRYVGCLCEMVYASEWGIPVVAYIGRNKLGQRLFFRYHSDVICRRWHDALAALGRCKRRRTTAYGAHK